MSNTTTDHSLLIERETRVAAPIDVTFAAMLEELGPGMTAGGDAPMPMVLEARPGGRWFRDLGDDQGHCWGHVQAIRRPELLEISGPLFMSYAVCNNVQYRLSTDGDGTLIRFHHNAFGLINPDHAAGVTTGWGEIMDRIVAAAAR